MEQDAFKELDLAGKLGRAFYAPKIVNERERDLTHVWAVSYKKRDMQFNYAKSVMFAMRSTRFDPTMVEATPEFHTYEILVTDFMSPTGRDFDVNKSNYHKALICSPPTHYYKLNAGLNGQLETVKGVIGFGLDHLQMVLDGKLPSVFSLDAIKKWDAVIPGKRVIFGH